jgi:cytoskeletal protein CcmA (bactofilin family)
MCLEKRNTSPALVQGEAVTSAAPRGASSAMPGNAPPARPAAPAGVPCVSPTSSTVALTPATPSQATQLVAGRGTSLSGTITGGDWLVVEGTASVTLHPIRALEIAASGHFTAGELEVEEAMISGIYEGDLIVRKRLLVCGSGRVSGRVRYGQLEIERGGQLCGSFFPLGDEPGEGA